MATRFSSWWEAFTNIFFDMEFFPADAHANLNLLGAQTLLQSLRLNQNGSSLVIRIYAKTLSREGSNNPLRSKRPLK